MNIRNARERLGLTLKDLASLAGVSIATLSKIENKKKVKLETLAKVVNALIEIEHYEIGL
jgi:transcriptional regulator with XRE-family HTH domain